MVALFLRPDADISDGGWTDEGGATTLFDAVDESSFSDTDYIKSSSAVGDKVSLRLSDPSGTVAEPMTIRVRCKREGTDPTDLIGRLYEATSPPTLICYFEIPTLTTSFADYTHELPAAEFAAIGDFNNLYIEFESNPTLSHHGSQIDLNFQTANYYNSTTPTVPANVTDYLSISRASIGYAKTSSGTLTQFSSNELRITNLGLLVEDSRTNVILYSQKIAGWSAVEATISDDQAVAPDGTTTAIKITDTATLDRHMMYQFVSQTADNWTLSVFAKAGTARYVAIDTHNATVSAICVDLQTGTVTDTEGDEVLSYSVEAYGNGWYRIAVSRDNTEGPGYVDISLSNSATPTWSAGAPSYTGDGTLTAYFWGAQLEIGTFPSSYIPTTTTSATRAADNVRGIGAGTLESVVGAVTSSVRYHMAPLHDNTAVAIQWFGTGASFSGFYLKTNGTNQIDTTNQAGTSLTCTLGSGTLLDGDVKLAFGGDGSGRSICANNGTVATDAVTHSVGSDISLGNGQGYNPYPFTYYRRVTAWNSRLSDTTLQTLTAP